MTRPRTKGTGYVFQRGPKPEKGPDTRPWYYCFVWQGKRYRESAESPRKADATRLLQKRIAEIRDGTYHPEKSGLTVKALATKWLAVAVATGRNEKGQQLAKYRAETYLYPFIGDTRADRVTKDTLRAYRLHLEGLTTGEGEEAVRTLSDQTVAHLLADARCLFIWAHDTGRIPTLPVPRKLLPKIEEREPRALSHDEQATVEALPGALGLACRIMIGTGLRWSELCRLTSTDLSRGELVVQGETKTKKLRRVPVPPALLAELRKHVGKFVPYEPLDNPTFCRTVQRRTGLEEFSAHRCRHSFAVNYLERGGNLRVLQTLMGHASLATTEIYLRIDQQLAREDAKRVMGWSPTA